MVHRREWEKGLRERERFDDVRREGERDRFAGENGETIYNLDWIEEWLAGKSRVINKIMSGGYNNRH